MGKWLGNIWGKLKECKGVFSGVCLLMQTHLGIDSPPPGIRVTLLFLLQKAGTPSGRKIYLTFLKGNLFPAFR